jgi:hypothetical protein
MSATIKKNVFLKMRKLLDNPENWCKSSFAQDKHKTNCTANDPDAYAFCLLGALFKTCDMRIDIANIHVFLTKHTKGGSVMAFNDNYRTTHKDIINFLDKMIEIS